MKFENYDEGKFQSQYQSEIVEISALQSLILGKELNDKETEFIRESKCVKEFLDLPLNAPQEGKLKKIYSTAIVTALDKGTLPFKIEKDPVAIASTIDEGLTRIKVAHKIAQGDFTSQDAADYIVDKVAARAIAQTEKIIEKGVPIVLDAACVALTNICPPAATIVPIIKLSEKYITPVVKKVVRKGINILAEGAKEIVSSAIEGVKTIGETIKDVFLSIFS